MRKTISVFLVDDNDMYLTAITHYLRQQLKSQIQIESFASGEDCLKEVEKNPTIEVIILDYYLHNGLSNSMNGLEALKKIKEINSNIIVIMLTVQDKFEIANDCINNGAYEYIVKSETAFIRAENVLRNLIHEVRLQPYYPVDIGGEG